MFPKAECALPVECWACSGPLGEPPMQCSRCRAAYYCSRSCQMEHWKRHKPTCQQPRPQPEPQPQPMCQQPRPQPEPQLQAICQQPRPHLEPQLQRPQAEGVAIASAQDGPAADASVAEARRARVRAAFAARAVAAEGAGEVADAPRRADGDRRTPPEEAVRPAPGRWAALAAVGSDRGLRDMADVGDGDAQLPAPAAPTASTSAVCNGAEAPRGASSAFELTAGALTLSVDERLRSLGLA